MRKVVVAFDPEIVPRNAEISPQKYLETLFAKAKLCGATLVDQVDHQTTHLVSGGETELARYGKQRGIWVVLPAWLEKSEHFWQRLKEDQFSVFKTYGTKSSRPGAPPQQTLPDLEPARVAATAVTSAPLSVTGANGDVEDDIDAFARQLELEM